MASERMRALRNSLRPAYESYSFARTPIRVSAVNLVTDCRQLPRRD